MRFLVFFILLFPTISAAETAEEIAWEIVNINDDYTKLKNEVSANLEQARELFISSFEPHSLSPNSSPELIAQREQLYLDAQHSSTFILDFDKVQNAVIADFVDNFTYAELSEIRAIFKKPIFKKIQNISETLDKRTTAYIRQWEEENNKQIQKFSERLDSLRTVIKNDEQK